MPEPPRLPPIARDGLCVVLPVHNQAAALAPAVGAWAAYLDTLDNPSELLLVDDGSTDDTPERAAELAGRHRRLRVLRLPSHQGFGAALRAALAEAKQPLFFYSALDHPYRPDDLKALLARIDETHLVTGCRAGRPVPPALRAVGRVWRLLVRVLLGSAPEPLPGWPGWRGWAYARLVRFLFGVRVLDVDSAFKLFRRSVFDRVPIQSDSSFCHTEILAK